MYILRSAVIFIMGFVFAVAVVAAQTRGYPTTLDSIALIVAPIGAMLHAYRNGVTNEA